MRSWRADSGEETERRWELGDSDETRVIQEMRARGLRTGDCEKETHERRFMLLMSGETGDSGEEIYSHRRWDPGQESQEKDPGDSGDETLETQQMRLRRQDPGQDTLSTQDSTLRKGHLGYSAEQTRLRLLKRGESWDLADETQEMRPWCLRRSRKETQERRRGLGDSGEET